MKPAREDIKTDPVRMKQLWAEFSNSGLGDKELLKDVIESVTGAGSLDKVF